MQIMDGGMVVQVVILLEDSSVSRVDYGSDTATASPKGTLSEC